MKINYNKAELLFIEDELIDITIGSGAKSFLLDSIKELKEKDITIKTFYSRILYLLMHGYMDVKTKEELNNYVYYSIYTKKNKKENKWRNEYENKICNTNSR